MKYILRIFVMTLCLLLLFIVNFHAMAHNINFNEQTGLHSFFSVKEKAWHGLGQVVDKYPTSAEAIKHAGLDWEPVCILILKIIY